MIYDPVNVRISVSNKRQVWYGGPESPDPPPKSATINIVYKPNFWVSVIFGIVTACTLDFLKISSVIILFHFTFRFLVALPLIALTLFESLSRKHICFHILVDCDSAIGL